MNSSSNYHSKWNSFLLCFNERRKVLFRIKMEKFPSLVFCYVTLKMSNQLYSASSHSFSLIIYSPDLCTSKYQNKTCWPFSWSILCKMGFYSSCCCCLEKTFLHTRWLKPLSHKREEENPIMKLFVGQKVLFVTEVLRFT